MSKLKLKLMTKKALKLKHKRGAELVESILIIGITITLIVVIFYPQIMSIMTVGFNSIQTWFSGALSKIGQPLI
ncbi:MAG: hypothetical protein K0R72_643 [Clostridia bacterium]|jgi:uncharacterized membrane protein|nr:hypothetical protein [Clostridia bacterium]